MGDRTAQQTAQERIARHQHAAEILRARSVLAIAFSLWLVVGLGLDLVTFRFLGTGPFAFVVGVRLASVVFHATVLALLYRGNLAPRIANGLVSSVFPVTSLALTLMASQMGGLASPYVSALYVGLMAQGIAWPGPVRRGASIAFTSIAAYIGGMLLATRFDAGLEAQLHDTAALTSFVVHAAVMVAAGIVVTWGGNVMWSLRQSVFESRNLGRYRLVTRIGKGGMGEVWHAHDRALRRDVALKILSPEHGRHPAAIARFEREIHATSEVAHPNVIRIHDWGITDDGVWYYAMDLLEGVDLATMVKRSGPMPAELVIELGTGAAAGLAEAHRRGVIHRDIKPGNLFVIAEDGEPSRLELLDFGIARTQDDPDLTQQGAIMGTPPYMAPEVLAGAPGGTTADAYGLGASLYFALAGKPPRDAKGVAVSSLVTDVPAALDDLLVRALDAEPSRRPTAEEMEISLTKMAEKRWKGTWRVSRVVTTVPPPDDDGTDPAIDQEDDAPMTVPEPIKHSRMPPE